MKRTRYGHVCDEIKDRGKQKDLLLFNKDRPQPPKLELLPLLKNKHLLLIESREEYINNQKTNLD